MLKVVGYPSLDALIDDTVPAGRSASGPPLAGASDDEREALTSSRKRRTATGKLVS